MRIVLPVELYFILVLCPCDARFNQNSYVNYKIDNKINDYFTFKLYNECILCKTNVL